MQQTHDLALTRVLDAPVGQVWRSLTEPERVQRWWGPTGFTCPVAEMDVREGGTSLVAMRAPADYGGQVMYTTWSYRRVEEPELLEYVLAFTDAERAPLDAASIPPGVPREVPHRVTLRPLDGGRTELVVREYGYATSEARDVSRAGLQQCLDKLEALHRRS